MDIKRVRGDKGSIVVEAALVFPIIFLCIVAVIYICLILYQHVYIQVLVNMGAQRGAATWDNSKKTVVTGFIAKNDLGSELYGLGSGAKKGNVEKFVRDRINWFTVLSTSESGQSDRVDIDYKNYILYKKLIVNVDKDYDIPVGNLLQAFGLSKKFTISARAERVMDEPAEFIRNTDFLVEVEEELAKKSKIVGAIDKGYDKFLDLIKKMEDAVTKFAKN